MADAVFDDDDEQLRQAFLDDMPGRIAALEAARVLLGPAPAEGEAALRRLAHMLRGSAGSFGFPDVSEAAALAEDAASGDLDDRTVALIATIRRAVRRGRRRRAKPGATRRAPRRKTRKPATPDAHTPPSPPEPAASLASAAPASPASSARPPGPQSPPRTRPSEPPATAAAPPAAADQRARVLVVEDDPALSRLLRGVLDAPGREIVVAGTGAEAARAIQSGPFALIMLDLHLPDGDGRLLLTDWRRAGPTRDVPIFVLSADIGPQTKAECFAAGADACFDKPFRAEVIGAAVSARLARAGHRDAPPPPRSERKGPARVLVVEDDSLVASMVRHRLSRVGIEVQHAPDGASAVAALDQRPDLVVLDLNLPELNGFQVLERIRAGGAAPRVPVLILTASGAESALVRAFELGADDYVVKPFSPTELLARVQRLLVGDSGRFPPAAPHS